MKNRLIQENGKDILDSNWTSVTISKDRYLELLETEFKMECLTNYGVDNWEGYSSSLEEYFEYQDGK